MAKIFMQKLILVQINKNEIIMAKLNMAKLKMVKQTMNK